MPRARWLTRQRVSIEPWVSRILLVDDLRRSETDASLRQFERGFAEFHGAVKNALDEYLHGNTLVMDLMKSLKIK